MHSMQAAILVALSELARERPCFHSEADFQFALAWYLQAFSREFRVRLEMPIALSDRRVHVDIFVLSGDQRTAVELKYWKGPLHVTLSGERFEHRDMAAHDLGRYDFCKDVQKLEHMLAADRADSAFALALTNQPKYWTAHTRGNNVDAEFVLDDGRVLGGEMRWAEHVGGTSKGREAPISLQGEYTLAWKDYSVVEGQPYGEFRFLLVQAGPVFVTPSSGGVLVPSTCGPTRRWAGRYARIAGLFGPDVGDTLVARFDDIERVCGQLPRSARDYTAWWANHQGNPQARWMDCGFYVRSADLNRELVVFERRSSNTQSTGSLGT